MAEENPLGNAFSLLSPEVKKLVMERFREPTPVQQEIIPLVMQGKNVLVISETGSGKTESCLLPIFCRLIKEGEKPISAIYICPLKSLNRDLQKRILWWSEELGFETSVRHGDTTQYERGMQAANPPHLLVITPETLQAILVGKIMRQHLRNVRHIVVDEVHELVGNKRGVQLAAGLARLDRLITEHGGRKPQVIGLSATVGSPENVARFLAGDRECRIVDTEKLKTADITVECPRPDKGDMETGSRLLIPPELAARLRTIKEYLASKQSVLVFTNTRESAEVLSSRLRILDPDIKLSAHHSSLSKEMRIKAEEAFKEGGLNAMVCTSSLELGIDIGSVDFMLQYKSPRQAAKLLQRVGRAGHSLDRVSSGVIISTDAEDCFEASVIAKQALEGRIEPVRTYPGALDVLASQVVGLALEEYGIPVTKAFSILKKAAIFSRMTMEEFLGICNFMQRLGLVWIDREEGEPLLKRRRKAWEHYYQNLSTIPDVRNFRVFDVTTNQPVGMLGSEFINTHGSPGTAFICGGRTWRILEVMRDRVSVEPLGSVEGAVPAWEGELMHVPFQAAQGVGRLRAGVAGCSGNEVRYIMDNYPVSLDAAEVMASMITEQKKWGAVPTDKDILVEHGSHSGTGGRTGFDYVIFHTCFGSGINETLGRAMSAMLTYKPGPVEFRTDPYRITLKFPIGLGRTEQALKLLEGLDLKTVKDVLETTLPSSELFSWRFLHVAKRFGVISRDANFGKGYLGKIIKTYSNSPLHKEALNEIWQEKLDLDGTGKVLEMIRKGEVSFTVRPGISPIGRAGIIRTRETIPDARPGDMLDAVRQRLYSTKVRMLCCNCGWGTTHTVKELPDDFKCLICGARLMGLIKPGERDKERLLKRFIKKKALTKEELDIVNSVMKTAGLIIGSGRRAVLALAGRGMGPKTASRILARAGDEDALIKAILEAESAFSRTKHSWADSSQ